MEYSALYPTAVRTSNPTFFTTNTVNSVATCYGDRNWCTWPLNHISKHCKNSALLSKPIEQLFYFTLAWSMSREVGIPGVPTANWLTDIEYTDSKVRLGLIKSKIYASKNITTSIIITIEVNPETAENMWVSWHWYFLEELHWNRPSGGKASMKGLEVRIVGQCQNEKKSIPTKPKYNPFGTDTEIQTNSC
jgi:hypothetical protein